VLLHRGHKPGLAHARFADDEHDLPQTVLRAFPAILQQVDLVLAAAEGGEPGLRLRVEGRAADR
jgi:hypothetical protein